MHKLKKMAAYFVLLSCSIIAACGSVLESGKPARQVYLLTTPSAPAGSPQTEPMPTLILSVKAVPGLDTDLVLVLGNDARLNPVANAHWADNLPEVFTSITRRYLSDTGRFRAVRVSSISRPDEWLLNLELQAFYGTQDAAGTTSGVVLRLEGSLRCNEQDNVIRIDQKTGANGDSLAGLVAAHQRVLDDAMRELPDKIISACAG